MSTTIANRNGNGAVKGGLNRRDGALGLGDIPVPATALSEGQTAIARPAKIPDFDINAAISAASVAIEQEEELAAEIRKEAADRMMEILPTIVAIRKARKKHGDKFMEQIAGMNTEGEQYTFQEVLDAKESEEQNILDSDDMNERAAGHMAEIEFCLAQAGNRQEFLWVIDRLEKAGKLVAAPTGKIRVFHNGYRLSDDKEFGGLGPQDEKRVAGLIAEAAKRITGEEKQEVIRQGEQLKELATITDPDTLSSYKTQGTMYLVVPPGTVSDGEDTFQIRYHLHILIELEGGQIRLSEAVGPDAEDVMDMLSRTYLKANTLEWFNPPNLATLGQKMERNLAVNIWSFWHMMKWATKKARKARKNEAPQTEVSES